MLKFLWSKSELKASAKLILRCIAGQTEKYAHKTCAQTALAGLNWCIINILATSEVVIHTERGGTTRISIHLPPSLRLNTSRVYIIKPWFLRLDNTKDFIYLCGLHQCRQQVIWCEWTPGELLLFKLFTLSGLIHHFWCRDAVLTLNVLFIHPITRTLYTRLRILHASLTHKSTISDYNHY